MTRPVDPVCEALDGATGDYAVSGDAMRWSPDQAETPDRSSLPSMPRAEAGAEAAAGLAALLGLDAAGMRRLVTGAFLSLGSTAGGVVGELRQRARGAVGDTEPTAEE